jgi:ion channel POLLUX/CASTOR
LGRTSRSLRNRTKASIATGSSSRRNRTRVGRTGRFRYAFDNSMSRGTPALVAWLGAATLVLILAFAALITIFDLRHGQRAADGHMGFVNELFQTMLHALDAGTVAGDAGGWPFLLTMMAVTVAGLFIVSALIGIIAAGIDAKIADLQRGRSMVIETGHTVILGWSDAVFPILSEFAIANENVRRPVVVILADRDKVEMERSIREQVSDLRTTRVVCRSGSPIDIADVGLSSPDRAKSIIVLSSEGPDPDSDAIKTLLALTHTDHEGPPVVVEIANPGNVATARMVGRGRAVIVDKQGTVARLIVRTSRESGAAAVYTELFDFAGDEIYFHHDHGLGDRTYGQVLRHLESAAVIGLIDDSGVPSLNPPQDTLVGERSLILLAEDDSALASLAVSSVVADETAITDELNAVEAPKRILLAGWNARAQAVVGELDNYAEPGSELTVLTEFGDPELPSLRTLTATVERGSTTSRSFLDLHVTPTLDQIIVLPYSDDLGVQKADAHTLVTLLHVRDIVGDELGGTAVVTELLDDRNRALAEVAHVDDVIVSDQILSLMVSQMNDDRRLERVFADLLDADGAEIYLRPAEWYVSLGATVSFATIVAAASARHETAFGYRSTEVGQTDRLSGGVIVNPAKSSTFTVCPGDRVIVLADS